MKLFIFLLLLLIASIGLLPYSFQRNTAKIFCTTALQAAQKEVSSASPMLPVTFIIYF